MKNVCLLLGVGFVGIVCLANARPQMDCFDIDALGKQMKPLKEKCPEPFDYETCTEHYECTAKFYGAWDDTSTPPGVKFSVLRGKMLEASITSYADTVAGWIDECHKTDPSCSIGFNKCFGEAMQKNCPKLMNYVPKPPDCSKDSDEEKK